MDVEKLEQRLAIIVARIAEIEALLKESTDEINSLDMVEEQEPEINND
jgi:chaperonin cofactor prefoldin